MSSDEITVRQWQENYRTGAYRSKDVDIQRGAGWWNWNCRNDALAGRLRLIAPVIMKLNEPFVLNHYCVWFVNEGKWREAIYDSVRFEPLDGGPDDVKFFKVDFRNPKEPDKWTLYTKRFGLHSQEFGCGHVDEMVTYIVGLARELEQGVRPPFLDEKAAAVKYIMFRDTVHPSRALRREGKEPVVLLGFRTAGDVLLEKEFAALGTQVHIATEDGSAGRKGFVTAVMPELSYTYLYACGPLPMLRAVDAAAKTGGQLSFEERMGCGFGVCMGCSRKTKSGSKRICKDGPVLERGEVLWDEQE